jgi:hypothetical protein
LDFACADAFRMAAIAADVAGAGTRDFNRRLEMPAIVVV